MIILAATATCVSVYLRTRIELGAAAARHKTVAEQVEELKLQAERLEREVGRLSSDARMIESYARHDLGLVRSGEVVIKIENGEKSPGMTSVSKRAEPLSLTPQTAESYTEPSN